MVQLESFTADVELERAAVRFVGIAVLHGPAETGRLELPLVDDCVVTRGEYVPIEPFGHELVRDHTGRRPSVLARLGFVQIDTEHVVDVTVGEDRGVESLPGPPPHRCVHLLGVEDPARVDHHQAVFGREHRRVGEGVDERDAAADFSQLAAGGERVVLLDGERTGEQPVGGVEQVHGRSLPFAVVATEIGTCSTFATMTTAELPGALARSQAARRRRVLDATLALAADGGFDAVQMRDVATAADVALGTVYRYFSSKERLLLEAMAEQQADLRAYLHTHVPTEATPAERVLAVLARSNRSLRKYPDVTAAMVRAFGSAAVENADIVHRVTEIMTDIITTAMQGTERHPPTERELRIARIFMQVWLSSLNGWVCAVDPPERVDEDLAAAAQLLLP